MYAVILAGGGGTRLQPLSTSERPKPFLPLVGERSLLQATVDRLAGLTDDITVVTDRRYERLVRDQAPDVALVLEPMGRNTAAAIALAALTIERSRRRRHGGAARRPDRSSAPPSSGTCCGPPPSTSRRARSAIEEPLVTLGVAGRPAGDRLRLPASPTWPRRGRSTGLRAYPLHAVRGEAEARPRRGAAPPGGRRLERRASSCGGAGSSSTRSAGTPGCSSRSAR